MRWGLALVILLMARPSSADVTVGGTGGITIGKSAYFPAFLIGGKAALTNAVAGPLSLGLEARLQVYTHPEDEDFGSWGFQEDVDAIVKLHMLADGHRANAFVAGRVGLAAVERVPFSEAPAEVFGGYLVGASVGVDLHLDSPVRRVELSFEWPSFTSHDDSSGPAGELSLSILAAVP